MGVAQITKSSESMIFDGSETVGINKVYEFVMFLQLLKDIKGLRF